MTILENYHYILYLFSYKERTRYRGGNVMIHMWWGTSGFYHMHSHLIFCKTYSVLSLKITNNRELCLFHSKRRKLDDFSGDLTGNWSLLRRICDTKCLFGVNWMHILSRVCHGKNWWKVFSCFFHGKRMFMRKKSHLNPPENTKCYTEIRSGRFDFVNVTVGARREEQQM